jgi:hypothetical protein
MNSNPNQVNSQEDFLSSKFWSSLYDVSEVDVPPRVRFAYKIDTGIAFTPVAQ